MNEYNPQEIEKKWQMYWEDQGLFQTPENVTKDNKFYILPQLPYPSGSGLHVGHAEVYTACDIYARYQRMKGKNVLQVIGWDSFGLPAENYAIKTNVHPQKSTNDAIDNFRSQIKALGISVDWDREVGSHNPDYYQWTQWFFLLMYNRGLAYRKNQAVNWCDSCKTVLANEQVTTEGNCERCGTEIIQREMEQWYLKITEYADRLLEGLDRIDWPEETKKRQRDWIGRSDGGEVKFLVRHSDRPQGAEESRVSKVEQRDPSTSDSPPAGGSSSARDDVFIDVFTTRPDTLFGATYMVLSPENELIGNMKPEIENWDEVNQYIEQTAKKTNLDRQIEKEKTGVELKGIKAINPVNGEEIPIWIADYVLAGYGTGAIMAVPAHDERDFVFAKKYGLPVREVVAKEVGSVRANEEKLEGVYGIFEKNGKILVMYEERYDLYRLPGGTKEIGENDIQTLEREFSEETGYVHPIVQDYVGQVAVHFLTSKHREVVFYMRKAYRILIENEERTEELLEEDAGAYRYMWMDKDEAIEAFDKNKYSKIVPHDTGEGELIKKYFGITDNSMSAEGVSINSDFLNNLPTSEAKEKMIVWLEEHGVGKRKVQYKLRDWSVSRQRFWGAPIPVIRNQKFVLEHQCFLKIGNQGLSERVIHVHAWGANPDSHFRPWLREQEKKLGIESITPLLPHADLPVNSEWLETVNDALGEQTINTVLTGRSLGCWTALQASQTHVLRKLILIAPTLPIDEWYARFQSVVHDEKEQKTVTEFVRGDLDYKKIQENVGDIVIFLSTDDPYIPLEASEAFFAEHLPFARIIRVRDAGHFDTDDHGAYTTFPMLLDEIIRPVRPDLRALMMSDLPVLLPDDVDFKPTGESPLNYSPSFNDGVEEKYGEGWTREPDTLDTFMCSSWYYYRYLDPKNNECFASREQLKKWMPVDFYLGGPEHVNGHLLYSRFFTKVLYDAGYIDFDEPFTVHRHQGLILGEDNRKMSKRWGNVVNPTDVIHEFGADTCRVYEMFMGPLEDDKPWSTDGVRGVKRFLERVWRLQDTRHETRNMRHDLKIERLVHKTIKKVGEDLAVLKCNTAIAKLMELVNVFTKAGEISQHHFEILIKLLSPFAPHICEELWRLLGNKQSISLESWPAFDVEKIAEDTMTIAVQVNGKLRATFDVPIDMSEDDIQAFALENESVMKWVGDSVPKKVMYVKGKLVSVVVE